MTTATRDVALEYARQQLPKFAATQMKSVW
jgi:hypothetical protein